MEFQLKGAPDLGKCRENMGNTSVCGWTTQGGCNQSCVEPCFATLREHLLAWLDFFFVRAKNETKLLDLLERFFTISAQKNLVLSMTNSVFFLRRIRWCGRIIDDMGVTMDPSIFQGLLNAEEPRTASELVE